MFSLSPSDTSTFRMCAWKAPLPWGSAVELQIAQNVTADGEDSRHDARSRPQWVDRAAFYLASAGEGHRALAGAGRTRRRRRPAHAAGRGSAPAPGVRDRGPGLCPRRRPAADPRHGDRAPRGCGACSARSGWRPSRRRTVPSPPRDPPSIPASTPAATAQSARRPVGAGSHLRLPESVPARSGPCRAGLPRPRVRPPGNAPAGLRRDRGGCGKRALHRPGSSPGVDARTVRVGASDESRPTTCGTEPACPMLAPPARRRGILR
jgi:hypothetical protein